ncbi:RPB11 [Sanghuangporus vaninii]
MMVIIYLSSGINAIQRHELYVLDDGEKPLVITEDTKVPNAATFQIVKQDHTLANMLRHQLLSNPAVLFAGYKVPHPLQPNFQLKIQTDGSITPVDAVERAAADLIGTLTTLETKFRREFTYLEMEGTDGTGAVGLGRVGAGDVGLDAAGAYGEGAAWSGRDYLDI